MKKSERKRKQEKEKKIIITVDGPAGSGKTTIAKMLSEKLKLYHLSSGKIYRAIAYLEMNYGLEKALELAEKLKIRKNKIFFEGENLDEYLSKEEVGKRASDISEIKEVREKVNKIQKEIAERVKKGIVVDGRDEGTEVFPSANIKIFIDASLEERARRKYLESAQKGENKTFEFFLETIRKRDAQDSQRAISPLRIPHDSLYIDSTSKTPEEVLEEILNFIKIQKPEILRSLNVDL